MANETATFAAGCFWGVELAFSGMKGVVETAVGFTGGWMEDPTYEDVCTEATGHAESVQVVFDTDKTSYDKLLEMFWEIHDPTSINHQGPDVGSQYRSVIFYHSSEQKEAAERSKAALEASGRYRLPIVTKIEPAEVFYKAEEYHQKYFQKRGLRN